MKAKETATHFQIYTPVQNYDILMTIYSELSHLNVNRFIGCIMETTYTAVMTEYCSWRSLKMILSQHDTATSNSPSSMTPQMALPTFTVRKFSTRGCTSIAA